MTVADRHDPYDPDLVLRPPAWPALAAFNRSGVLGPAEVHTATRLARLAGEDREAVVLAVALAVRAPRVGHVSLDLDRVRSSVVVVGDEDVDLDLLPWPDPGGWSEVVATSPLVTSASATSPSVTGGTAGRAVAGHQSPGSAPEPVEGGDRPLRLVGSALYLDRYWRDEAEVAAGLLARAVPAGAGDPGAADTGAGDPSGLALDRLFPGEGGADQRRAAQVAAGGRLTVIAGGPGTGKTTTVARILAGLFEVAERSGQRPPLVALAAPTGKAAARMEEAVRAESARMASSGATRRALSEVNGSTIHRLLGSRPDRSSRFRHHRGHRLPHDVVVVDEASMVSLSLMARLVEAVRPDARLILVGDPEQLVSVEAGAVLADIVGPAPIHAAGPARGGTAGTGLAGTGLAGRAPVSGPLATCVVQLRRNHRFSGVLASLAQAIRAGDGSSATAVLRSGEAGVVWIEADPAAVADIELSHPVPGPATASGPAGSPAAWVAETAVWAAGITTAARAGDAAGALAALAEHRVLCAHRQGGAGVALWNRRMEQWLVAAVPEMAGEGSWYAGRPVMVTANDYSLRLFNGDTGVVVTGPGGPASSIPPAPPDSGRGERSVAFESGPSGRRLVSPYRLAAVETVFAMTVHKSQGSEFERVSLLLPPATSRVLTRELLYTAVTRARTAVTLIGTEDALREAVDRPIARASGLAGLLWASPPGSGPAAG